MEVAVSSMEPASTMSATSPPTPSTVSMISRPQMSRASHSNPNLSTLPPLVTNSTVASGGARAQAVHKKPSFAKLKHLSTYSNTSGSATFSSRPESYVFPAFHSSLPYALVRDFAYSSSHPLHYGPPPNEDPSTASTPASEFNRRLSDPPKTMWPPTRAQWAATDSGMINVSSELTNAGPHLPATSYGGGPPYREDDDLLSPVVTSSRHKKSKSNIVDYDFALSLQGSGSHGLNDAAYYQRQGNPVSRYPSDQQHVKTWQQRQAEEDTQPPPLQTDLEKPFNKFDEETEWSHADAYGYSAGYNDESRYSRDYQFTIASPDEEMHGKAVALFDFKRENENELELVEGQVILVSYRHGQGWLVAQDPRSGESGLVPEEYVRLVRDIEGGIRGLNGLAAPGDEITEDIDTPTLDTLAPYSMSYSSNVSRSNTTQSHQRTESGKSTSTSASSVQGQGDYYAPVQSHFSTSSKDLQPYPQHHLLGSQANTPIAHTEATSLHDGVSLSKNASNQRLDDGSDTIAVPSPKGNKNKGSEADKERDTSGLGVGLNSNPSAMASVFGSNTTTLPERRKSSASTRSNGSKTERKKKR